MSSMLNIAISGLNAAQVALSTTSNNISNASTSGYSEESVLQTEQVNGHGNSYTIGSGVDVETVQRAYSQYLTQALWSANTGMQGATTSNSLNSTLNSIFSGSGNLQTDLDDFYGDFSSIASAPSSSSTREAALGGASSVAQFYNTLSAQLSEQSESVNGQVGDAVTSINDLSKQIATLNNQILQSGGTTSDDNALLDQRDSLVQQLSSYAGITASTDSSGSVSVYLSSGTTLVSGTQSYALSSGGNAYDASSTDVFDSSGNDITSQINGGSLGALIDYRDNVLEPTQNALGQSAIALASSVNAQQADGLDLNGEQGKAIFSVSSPDVLGSSKNTGTGTVSASISDVSQLTSSDYILKYTGTGTGTDGWSMTTTDGTAVPLTANADGSLSADGLTIDVSGSPATGDSYEIQPTRSAAGSLSVVMTDPDGIAAAAALAATSGTSNTGSGVAGAVTVTDSSNSALLSGATITFGASNSYTITDGAGNTTTGTYTAGTPISADGWSLSLSGTPASGDTFSVAANTNGLADDSNALALANLADTGVLDGGKTSVVDSYANLTTTVGNAGSQASSNLTTQTALYNEAESNQQSLAGVNLNQEAANLVQFQQAYQASAQVISTAQQLFTSLITALQA